MLNAFVRASAQNILSPVDPRLFSSFVEHMGRAVYTGIYEPGHPEADADGFREDVRQAVRPLNLACIRYPGGNFVSGYHWRDGVGPKEKRPLRRDLAWRALEPNQVGVDEFCHWCRSVGAEPMLAVNLGTGTPEEAARLLEYCNAPADGSSLAALRRENGSPDPHGVRLWCLGNEMDGPWQICAKTATEYGRLAHETAKMMKWLDPDIELVVCGSSNRDMPTFGSWEREVLRHCWDEADYLSLHSYYQNLDGDLPSFLARSEEMDAFIREVETVCEEIRREKGSEKQMHLSFDEWNVWYHFQKEKTEPPRWTCPRAIEEEEYDFADALLVGSLLTVLLNHADHVKIACLAQLVNVIAPIMTEPDGGVWLQTIYWPFLQASRFGRGAALRLETDAPSYACALKPDASYLSAAATLCEDGKTVTLFAVNKSWNEEMRLKVSGLCGRMTEWSSLCGFDAGARNAARTQPVAPRALPPCALDAIVLPPASWNVIRIELGKA